MAQLPTVQITVDGKKVSLPPGIYHFRDIVGGAGLNSRTNKITVVSGPPSPPAAINGNDSYNIVGGEVFTTTHS